MRQGEDVQRALREKAAKRDQDRAALQQQLEAAKAAGDAARRRAEEAERAAAGARQAVAVAQSAAAGHVAQAKVGRVGVGVCLLGGYILAVLAVSARTPHAHLTLSVGIQINPHRRHHPQTLAQSLQEQLAKAQAEAAQLQSRLSAERQRALDDAAALRRAFEAGMAVLDNGVKAAAAKMATDMVTELDRARRRAEGGGGG